MGYRVTIDDELCTASLLCTRVAPMVFRSGADGRTEVITDVFTHGPADDLRWVVEEALQRCPQQAISIERTPD